MIDDAEQSVNDDATFAGGAKPQRRDVSMNDDRTLGGVGDASGIDTVMEGVEVVDFDSRYTIEGPLGQGGMGAVLLATDTRLGRKVAIKRILGEAAGNRLAVQRFLTEAKAVAAINHPNVVQIYDYALAKDGPYLSMEYVEGGSLAERCKEGAMAVHEAIDLACQLCDGLAKAHDLGIIHRDIKPANVLLTPDGVPKLTDFGLAKAEASDHQMTMTGAVMGTPDFMSPEQRRGASEVDARSDLWSLAATFYQMVSGRSPKVIRFDLLPGHLTKVLGTALEDAKSDRYQTVREFRKALAEAGNASASAISASATSTSPASASPRPDGATLAEGQCKACGTVTSDLTKKFCRNPECGASLRVSCLQCDSQMPVWDGVCGECGGNQIALTREKKAEFLRLKEVAENSLAKGDFSEAVRIAQQLSADKVSGFEDVHNWADDFLKTVDETRKRHDDAKAKLAEEEAAAHRAREVKKANENLAQAEMHLANKRYRKALNIANSIPQRFRPYGAQDVINDAKAQEARFQSHLKFITEHKNSPQPDTIRRVLRRLSKAIELTPDDEVATLTDLRADLLAEEATALEAIKAVAPLVDAGEIEEANSILKKDGLESRNRFVAAEVRRLQKMQVVMVAEASLKDAEASLKAMVTEVRRTGNATGRELDEIVCTLAKVLALEKTNTLALKVLTELRARCERDNGRFFDRLSDGQKEQLLSVFSSAGFVLPSPVMHYPEAKVVRDDTLAVFLGRCNGDNQEKLKERYRKWRLVTTFRDTAGFAPHAMRATCSEKLIGFYTDGVIVNPDGVQHDSLGEGLEVVEYRQIDSCEVSAVSRDLGSQMVATLVVLAVIGLVPSAAVSWVFLGSVLPWRPVEPLGTAGWGVCVVLLAWNCFCLLVAVVGMRADDAEKVRVRVRIGGQSLSTETTREIGERFQRKVHGRV